MKSKKIKSKKTDIICMIIAFVCFSIGGALVVFCGVDTHSATHSFHLPYRSGNVFVRPWIGWTIIASAIIGSLSACIFMLSNFFD